MPEMTHDVDAHDLGKRLETALKAAMDWHAGRLNTAETRAELVDLVVETTCRIIGPIENHIDFQCATDGIGTLIVTPVPKTAYGEALLKSWGWPADPVFVLEPPAPIELKK
jgi:hypothetical protein